MILLLAVMELQGLLDSKKEYIEHLCDTFAEPMVGFFQRLYNDSLDKPEARGKSVLAFFQEQLGSITEWNISKITDEYRIAKKRSGCNYINDLIKAILVTYVKIALLSNSSTTDSSKVKLRVPAPENFYHRCLIICAREIWKQPYLLYHKVRSIEIQRNLNELESIAKKAIKSAVRMYIPLDQLVRDIRLEPVPPSTKDESQSEGETESSSDNDECIVEEESESDCDVEEDPESEPDEPVVAEEDPESEPDEPVVAEEDPEIESCEQQVVVAEEDPESEPDKPVVAEEEDPESEPCEQQVVVQTYEDADKELIETERKSIEINATPLIIQRDTTCDVDKLEYEPMSESSTNTEEVKKKKLIMGSMLINRGRHKLINVARPPKADAFF